MTYPATPTFWLEPTERVSVGLRRYHAPHGAEFTCAGGYHAALVFTGEEPIVYADGAGTGDRRAMARRPATPEDDPRWPTHCERECGYEFVEDDYWQDWQEAIYRRTDTGDLVTLRPPREDGHGGLPGAPAGASWDAWWMPDAWRGPDRIALMVRCPNGQDWHVDGRASNCGLPDDDVHKCWVRHGAPRACNVTVDKNGVTCVAGGGSIQAGDYHGFLQNGVLTAG